MHRFAMTACLALVLLAGCGGETTNSPVTVDVSGIVTLNGQPLPDATVYFFTDSFASVAKTAADGSYRLVQGALPGRNKVYITKMEGGELVSDPAAGMDAGQFRAMQRAAQGPAASQSPAGLPRELVPAAYSDPSTTTLSYDVPEQGTASADFRL